MRKIAIFALVSASLLAGAGAALADHPDEGLRFPWSDPTDHGAQPRGKKKLRPDVEEADVHWGKHHHHGIHLEGSEFTPGRDAPAYD